MLRFLRSAGHGWGRAERKALQGKWQEMINGWNQWRIQESGKGGATPKGGGTWPGAHTAEGGGMSEYFFSYALMATAACRESFVT